jgi:hypothetical protein
MGSGNIQDFLRSCKVVAGDLVDDWGLYMAIILLGLASFGLGRLSALESLKQPLTVSQAAAAAAPHTMDPGGHYVASRAGAVYYYPWCGGASSIAPENQVWFKSEEAAKGAGYSPAKNCKGLIAK